MKRLRTLLWLRQDLRIEDHPALTSAMERGDVIPVYIWDPAAEGEWALGGASRWWLHHSLKSLQEDLQTIGLTLIIRQGDSYRNLQNILKESQADAVFWSRRYEPDALSHDADIKTKLRSNGVEVQTFNASLLYEPWTVANKQGKPFQVFTPFWNACQSFLEPAPPLTVPKHSSKQELSIESLTLDNLGLLPKVHWSDGIEKAWKPGTAEAKKRLVKFIKHGLENYTQERDYPAVDGISQMSPYLHFGEISPRMIWHTVRAKGKHGEPYLRQLGWREFAYHQLYHFPYTPTLPLRKEFSNFPWKKNPFALKAWQKGLTGYPLVDAGMRQLWHTGWMHNRVRMVVGSFLVKDLLIHWLEGARWFWDTLVDADLANNTFGWQWVGGCGADAAPYFRIFNPVTQSEKFDSHGHYIRKWVPELAALPDKWIHRPWEAPAEVLMQAYVILGKDYPYPIVDHAKARLEALTAFKELSSI